MSAQKHLPSRLGAIWPDDGEPIPIYGVDQIELSRSACWNIRNVASQSVYVMKWEGDEPVKYAFNFELVAGITVKTREELFKHMKTAHAMAAHQMKDGLVKSPPVCNLVLGEYINTKGLVECVTVVAKPPWGAAAGMGDPSAAKPTAVTFRGTFVVAPGYTPQGIINVDKNNQDLSAERVIGSFYKT